MKRFRFVSIIFIFMALLWINCTALQELAQIQRPTLHVAGVRMTGLSMQKIDLAFDVDIENPNPISIRLAGLDYDFQMNHVNIPVDHSGTLNITK